MESPFKVELGFYRTKLPELLQASRDKFVLIKGEKLLGVFETRQEAVRAGYEQLGNVPFLIRQVTDIDLAPQLPAAALN